jgi:glycosyltransferase involved in cell wall biosynthesis
MLSLILPARNWPGDRIEACVRSFLRLKSKSLTEIVVVDFGSDEPIALKVRDKRIRVVRVEAERWSLAEAINVGVIASRNPIVAKTDADIVIARESGPGLDAAVAALQRGDFGLAVVQAIDLPAGLDAGPALTADSASLLSEGRLRPRWGQGGLCLFSVTVWNDIGGFESRFHGWGNEDNDFADRVRRSGRRMRWLNAEATRIFHVWHPPTYAEKDIVKARAANQQVYNGDKSTLRPIRFLHIRKSSLPKPNVITTPRPLVTVAFASKARPHRERMLGEAIRGFAGQIDNDFEVLIADNGSTDEERQRLKASLARLPRALAVRVIDIDKPSIPAARNRLTDEARGRYVCIADDDDIPLRTRLTDHLAPFEKNAAIHGTHGGWIDFDEVTGVIDFNTGGTRTLETMLFGRGKVTAHPASFFRRDAMQAAPYDESIVAGSDLDLAVRMANMGLTVAHTDSYVTLRRFHQSNITITNLFGQVSTGVDSRQRVADTLGSVVEQQMREAGKAVPANVTCHNAISRDEIVGLIPGYSGVWRLLLPLVDLGGDDAAEGPARTAVDGGPLAIASPLNGAGLAARAAELARMVKGDVGTIDSGFDPELYFVSEPIKGAKKALAIRQLLEKTFDLEVDLIPDVEFQTRRMKRFDWSTLAARTPAGLLVSEPIKEIDNAVAALARIPGNTALRAMTSILADFNCTNPQYHLVTTAIPTANGPRAVKRALEEQTGESFRIVAGESPQQRGQTP